LTGRKIDLLERLRDNPNEVLVELYKNYRKEFLSWTYKTYGAGSEMSSDCFQDAMVVLYKNVQNEKLTDLQSSIKTYVFSIGKNILFRKLNSEQREIPLNEDIYKNETVDNLEYPELYNGSTIENKIADLVQTLKDPCKSILRYFYFRGFSMEEIANEMKYKNAQTVKAQKVRCIKEIQHLVHRKMRVNL